MRLQQATVLGVLLFIGCSSGQLPTYPVVGTVGFADGSPVVLGTVEFKSRDHGTIARGEIDSEGRFSLSTYRQADGAVAGKHDCVIVQLVITEGVRNFRGSSQGVVHPKHARYSTTGLVAEVAPIGKNEISLIVEPLVAPKPGEKRVPHDHLGVHR